MFEVVTLKNLGLEVTGMRKWLDIDEHVVPHGHIIQKELYH